MSKETVTLDNFADFQGEVHGVEIQSNLPFDSYVPSTEIDVNLGRIARAAKFGHLGSIAFKRYSEQSSIIPVVDSVSEDGSATASFSATASKTPRIDSSLLSQNTGIYDKGSGTVKINFGHDDLANINVREAKPWADYLDTTIGAGLRSCSNRKLFSSRAYRALMTGIYAWRPLLDLTGHNMDGLTHDYVNSLAWYTLVIGGIGYFGGTGGEFTLTPAVSLDRLGLVQTYTRTRKFVEAK